MSISRSDFARSLAVLDPAAVLDATSVAHVRLDGVAARLQFEALAPRTLGGLLSMPQARITITFEGSLASQREAFLVRFDVAFQRGGG